MCTLIAGVEILGPRTLVLGANRDESPSRESRGPAVLREDPRVVGGQDLVAGGTWLAVREARFVTALMNRRPRPGGPVPAGPPGQAPSADSRSLRSRGLLCLDAAAAGPPLDRAGRIDPGTGERDPSRLRAALTLLERDAYSACTLVGLSVDEPSWATLAESGARTEIRPLEAGWHVITHADVDDPGEPRTAWLLARLNGFRPATVEEAFERMGSLLSTHADPARGIPGVCLHRDHFPTVSSSLIAIGGLGPQRYLHAAGPPCVTPFEDFSALLA